MLPTVNSANQWMKCNGSVLAQELHPGTPGELSESKLEGRACHEVAQKIIAVFRNEPDTPLFSDLVGSLSKDGVLITQELFEAAREYVNDVLKYCRENGLTEALQVEQRVGLSKYLPEWYGIPDAVVYNPLENTLVIWDAKFGHRLVEAFENWPMLIYAMGKVEDLGLNNQTLITLRVVQPRGFHSGGIIREWSLSRAELFIYETQLTQGLNSVRNPTPPTAVGPQCLDCSARANCDTLSRVNYDNIDYMRDLSTHTLTGHSLGVELKLLRRAKKMLEYRLSGLEEQAIHEIKSGKNVSFFGAQAGKGRELWKKDVPTDQVIMMGDLMGVDIRKPVELDTPSQVRKKGISEEVIAQYSETPTTGLKLVERDEKSVKLIFDKTC